MTRLEDVARLIDDVDARLKERRSRRASIRRRARRAERRARRQRRGHTHDRAGRPL